MAVTPSAELLISLRLSEVAGSGPGRQVFRSDVLGPNRPLKQRMPNGSAAGQVDAVYFKAPTLGAGATLSLDLAGTLTDAEGNAITFATLKGIGVFNFDTDSTLDLKQPASNPVASLFLGGSGGGVLVQSARNADDPGVVLISIPNAITVTASTGDIIEIVNNDGSNAANFYVALWGVSA